MKNGFVFLALLFCGSSFAQNFTNSSVFDYAVGDTLEILSFNYDGNCTSAAPPNVIYKVFKQKRFSPALDTIFYSTEVTTVNYFIAGGGYTSSTTTLPDDFFVTDLSSSAISFSLDNTFTCQTVKDTSYTGFCGAKIHERYAVSPAGCTEAPDVWFQIVEGAGIFHKYCNYKSVPAGKGSEVRLHAYRKANGAKCGSNVTIPNSISENRLNGERVSFFPNPGNGSIVLNNWSNGSVTAQVVSITGQLVSEVTAEGQRINLEFCLNPGIYYIRITDSNQQPLLIDKLIIN